jgi:SAM-dependent methyltransferase
VVAIDVSDASLEHHRHLKDKYGLDNLDLRLLPIEEVGALEREFDLIVSTGVLHHLADPRKGMQVLGDLLARDGVLAVMLYARYGRTGVEMMQAIFRELGLTQDVDSIAIVRDALACVPADHPVRRYISAAPDLDSDAGLIDTFLHGRDRSFTVDDCLALVDASGLTFQEWFLKSGYETLAVSGNPFLDEVAALPDRARWSVSEHLNGQISRHFFTSCRTDRPVDSYRIDFAAKRHTYFIPTFRFRCRLDGDVVSSPGWSERLGEVPAAILATVDGKCTITEISDLAHRRHELQHLSVDEVQSSVATLMERLWKRDVLAIIWR